MIRLIPLFALLLSAASCGDADDPNANRPRPVLNVTAPLPEPEPPARREEADIVPVRITTEAGDIVVALDVRRAPVTSRNFLRYVDARRFDGTYFYRAARRPRTRDQGFIQGGVRHNIRLAFEPIAHEPTDETGIRHLDGTISMARDAPGSAMGDFFITIGAAPSMDAGDGPDDPGFAAFGRVRSGMDVARRILAAPTVDNAGRGAMRGQMITAPIRIVSVRREE